MSFISVFAMLVFVAFSLVMGQGQTSITTTALADGKGLVTIYADGQKKTVATTAKTIGEVLKENSVELSQGDVVEPSLETRIDQPFYNINVYRSYPAVIVDGSKQITTLSGYRSPRKVVESSGIKLYNEDRVSVNRAESFATDNSVGQKIIVERALPVVVVIGGTPYEFRTWQNTIGGLLDEKGISLMDNDPIKQRLNDGLEANMKIYVSRTTQEVTQVNEVIEPEIEYRDDPNQPITYRKTEREGKAGQKLVTYIINKKDGQEIDRKEVDSKVLTAAESKVVIRGTNRDAIGNNSELLYKLRMCETGGRYNANTGNGYYGAYQFSIPTWNRWNTGYARADLAPPEVQDAMVLKNAKASAGGFWSQHPGCSTKLGLPKFPY